MITKRGQVALFVIVGIVMVVGVIAAIIFMGRSGTSISIEKNPRGYIEKCVEDVVEKSVNKMLANGGEASPSRFIMYQGAKWNYLCHTADDYEPCINLHPLLELRIEDEIVDDTSDEIHDCFDTMMEDLEDKGFSVSGGATRYDVDLRPGVVAVNLRRSVEISKDGETRSFENFDVRVGSSLYELILVSRDIVRDEIEFCAFDYVWAMSNYPRYKIRRIGYDFAKIYMVQDRFSGDEFKFATRSCVAPIGI